MPQAWTAAAGGVPSAEEGTLRLCAALREAGRKLAALLATARRTYEAVCDACAELQGSPRELQAAVQAAGVPAALWDWAPGLDAVAVTKAVLGEMAAGLAAVVRDMHACRSLLPARP